MKKNKRILKPILILALFALIGVVIMLLWNALIPQIIGWSGVSYLQALGLILLCRLLFGGWGINKHRTPHNHHRQTNLKGMTKEQKREYILKYYNGSNEGSCKE